MSVGGITDKLGLHALGSTCAKTRDGSYEGLDWLSTALIRIIQKFICFILHYHKTFVNKILFCNEINEI